MDWYARGFVLAMASKMESSFPWSETVVRCNVTAHTVCGLGLDDLLQLGDLPVVVVDRLA